MYKISVSLLQISTALNMSIASFNILQILQDALSGWGYPAIVLFVMIESIGIPFPGETMLLLGAFYAATNSNLQIPIVIACAAAGAIVGDNIGYYIGRTGGKALVERYGHYIFLKPEHIERAEQFFEKQGDKAVFLGRFVAILRTWAAFLAGVNKMPWRTFLLYNAAGGIIWSIIYGLIGYFAGRIFHNNFAAVEKIARNVSWVTGGVIILIGVVIVVVYMRRRNKKHTN